MSNKSFSELNNDVLIRELNREEDSSRIVFALRCIQSLAKSRIDSLLDVYLSSGGQLYYNSIHWLDLGVSLPSKLSKAVAIQELQQY